MIAAGFGDLGGVTHELESRENTNASITRAKGAGSEHLPTSSMSSIQESVFASDGGEAESITMAVTVATAPSLSRAGSLNCRMHRRASRSIAREPTTPMCSVSPPAQSPSPTNLDVGMSLVLTPSPTLVPSLSAAAPKSPVIGSTHGPVPMTAGSMSSWMDTMGRKLSGLQKGQTYVV